MKFNNIVPIVSLVAACAFPVAANASQYDLNDTSSATIAPNPASLAWRTALSDLNLSAAEKQQVRSYVIHFQGDMQSGGGADPASHAADEQQLVEEIEAALTPAHRATFKRNMAAQRASSN